MSNSPPPSTKRYLIGYAMEPKKVKSIAQESLINLASKRGIDLVQIDPNKPLIEQAPFDVIIHKLYDQEWRNKLKKYSGENPNFVLIDPLEYIEKLHNRVTMLEVVGNAPDRAENVEIPKQIVVETNSVNFVEDLKFPVIAKPLLANGTIGSHQMYLVFDKNGLDELKPPFVLQEFINHGGVVFKVYVAGNHVTCVKRKSLPDISEAKLKLRSTSLNLVPFSQISNVTADDYSDDRAEKLIEETEVPDTRFVTELAQALRKGLKLNLFNFDMIRDSNDGNRFLVIDINYFPGYAKIPCYETMLTDFFLDVVEGKNI